MTPFDPIAYINEPRWQHSRLGLERITDLLERLGRPQDELRFVHVAGTNGKGSTCSFIESILRAAGYRTGLFTSPFILQFEERIRVDGLDISLSDLGEATLEVRDAAEAQFEETGEHPTEFELMTAVALVHFARSSCDVVVLEVGLGGRLDSTNVVDAPEACVITRIGLDHTGLLGDTVSQIAAEKAGIVKAGAAVVSYPQEPSARAVIERVAADAGCTVVEPDLGELEVGGGVGRGRRAFSYRGRPFETRMLGSYQPANAAVALETVEELRKRGWDISDDSIERGVASAFWPGRFEVRDARGAWPATVIDGGHNPQGACALADSLKDAFPGQSFTFVMSVLADKDYRAMIDALSPLARAFVCTAPDNPRALAADDLAEAVRAQTEGRSVPLEVVVAGDMAHALGIARRLTGEGGVMCVFGSLYALSAAYAVLDGGDS